MGLIENVGIATPSIRLNGIGSAVLAECPDDPVEAATWR